MLRSNGPLDFAGATATSALVALLACSPMQAAPPPSETAQPLVVRRGNLEQHLLLTGDVDTAKATEFATPKTDRWNVSIQWLAEDGVAVNKGDPVASFDNTAVLDKVIELELAAIEASVDLTAQEAKAGGETLEKRFELTERETEVAKAKLDTGVPVEILSRKEVREFSIALSRAEAALAKTKGELQQTEKGGKLEQAVKRIAFDKAKRAYNRAEEQLDALDLKAPHDGIFVVKKHPWQDRKLQVGDNVWPGVSVGGLPDLSNLVIEAELSDVDEGRLHAGMEASCLVDAYAEMPLYGVVASVTPVAQEAEARTRRRFFSVRVELEEVEEQILRPGLSAVVDVVTRRAKDVLIAPREALVFEASTAHALLADGTKAEVKIDFCTGLECVVTSGVDEGQALRHRRAEP